VPQLLRWGDTGLDRATGAPSASPEGFADLRNVLLLDRTLRLRPGIGDAISSVGAGLQVCHLELFRANASTIAVTYDPVTRNVDVYEGDLQGQGWTLVGAWGTLSTEATTPPLFSTCESFGILLLAHNEPVVTERLATYRYDPNAGTPFAVVQADLDGAGAADVKFAWVVTHYGYVFGAGFGSASEPFRPEMLRSSKADDPTVFEANDFAKIGVRGDGVLGAASHGGTLVIGKGSSLWALDGDSRATFQVRQIDPRVGLASHRALLSYQGVLYFWSPNGGPRATTGTEVLTAGVPLDLPSTYPPDLPALGPLNYCHVWLLPDERHLVFSFPLPGQARTLSYVLSLYRDTALPWNLWPLEAEILTATAVSTGIDALNLEPGFGDNLVTEGSVGVAEPSIDTTFDLNDAIGDETVEHWYKPDGGSWSQLATTPINTSAATQTVHASGAPLVSGDYTAAVRFRRGARYRDLYESSNPDDWPASARATGTIIAVATPSGVVVVYNFTDGSADVTWVNGDPTQDIEVELSRGSGTGTAIATPVAGTTTHNFAGGAGTAQHFARLAGLSVAPSGPGITVPSSVSALRMIRARVRHLVGTTPGAWSAFSAEVPCTYENAPDGAQTLRDFTEPIRTSVSLGTSYGLEITRPSSQVGDLTASAALSANGVGGAHYGAAPANGGCGTHPAAGPSVPLFSIVLTVAAAQPYLTGPIAAVPCATCNLVGQQVYLGLVWVVLGWTKAGDFAPHGATSFVALHGVSGLTCVV
jgi:hypothetical protein